MVEDESGLKVKRFAPDLMEWLDFVCACRDGQLIYQHAFRVQEGTGLAGECKSRRRFYLRRIH